MRFVLASALWGALVACTSRSASTPAPFQSGGPAPPGLGVGVGIGNGGGSSSSGGSGTSCNTVVQAGSSVSYVATASAPPTAAGGTIRSGTYVLTSARFYTASELPGSDLGLVGAETIVVTSDEIEEVVDIPESTRRVNQSISVTGVQLVRTTTCDDGPSDGGSGVETWGFTASETQLILVSPPDAPTDVSVLTFTIQ